MKVISRPTKKINVADLNALNELLKSGFATKSAFDLLRNKDNEKVINKICLRLDKGVEIEKIIGEYVPKDIALYLKPLLKITSFSRALDMSLSFMNKSRENNKELEKAILYPFILIFVSLSALYLFDYYGMDLILEMLKNFTDSANDIGVIRNIFRVIIYLFYFLFLIFVILMFYFLNEKNITLFYILISKYFPNSLVQTYFCEDFISLFLICLNLGYKTKDCLSILKSLHKKPIVSFLAFHLDKKLLEGSSFKDAGKQNYYDYTLSKFIDIAVYTTDFSKIMNDYVTFSRLKIKNKMKKLTLIIQLSSYMTIGFIIVFIYQILFLPMRAIANF